MSLFEESIFALMIMGCSLSAANVETKGQPKPQKLVARFEHCAFNVPDPVAAAAWYGKNLGMKVMRADTAPPYTTFIADSGAHMMMELYHNADYPLLNPGAIHYMSIHLAFTVDDIAAMKTKLVDAGAAIVDTLRKTSSGDQVMTLRDPWGLPIQFVQRIIPMLPFGGVHLEHFAVNVADSKAKAQWYEDNLGFVLLRSGGSIFIADSSKNMMFEFYTNTGAPLMQYDSISYMANHTAFVVGDMASARVVLLAAGAKLQTDIAKTASSDLVMMMRDPWGQPIQFVKRAAPMLK